MEINVTSWHEIQNNYVYDVISLRSPVRDPNSSNNGNLKDEKKFEQKCTNRKIVHGFLMERLIYACMIYVKDQVYIAHAKDISKQFGHENTRTVKKYINSSFIHF